MPGNLNHRLQLLRRRDRRDRARAGRRRRLLSAVAAATLLLALPGAASADQSQGDPALDYALQCRGCHGAEGYETEASDVPRLRGNVGRFAGVEGGRAYLVQVPGVANAPLDDAALAALLNWMLANFSPDELPTPFAPYTADEVARYRNLPKINITRRRAELRTLMATPQP